MTIQEIDGATVERLKQFYFECRLRSLGDAPRQDVPDMPDFRKIEFEDGDLKFLDLYTRSLGTFRSHGFINMWLNGRHVWSMSISGMFERRALPVLKDALHKAYSEKQFVAGRGPMSFEQGSFLYTSECSSWGFNSFQGHEMVWELDPEGASDQFGFPRRHSIGSQHYQGGFLVKVAK